MIKKWKCKDCYWYKNNKYIESNDDYWNLSVCGKGNNYSCVTSNYNQFKHKEQIIKMKSVSINIEFTVDEKHTDGLKVLVAISDDLRNKIESIGKVKILTHSVNIEDVDK